MARNAVNQANSAFNTAGSTGATLGGEAQGIGANVTPFLTQEMLHPEGYSQGDLSAMTAAAQGGAGGANAGLVGGADQRAAASRNAGGYSAALDDAARQREKASALGSEDIAAQNAGVKLNQQQQGASGLEKLYGVDTSGMLQSQGQEAPDVNAEANAGKSGWLQNTLGILNSINGAAKGFGGG